MNLVTKYPHLLAAVSPTEEELRADLRATTAIIDASPGSEEAIRLSVVANWIGQALRMRTPGLNGPLARAADR